MESKEIYQQPAFGVITYDTEDAWLQARSVGLGKGCVLGASEFGALIGEGYANQSAYSMFLEKTKGIKAPRRTDEDLWLGKELEPVVRRLFTRKTGLEVHTYESSDCTTASGIRGWWLHWMDGFSNPSLMDRECSFGTLELKVLGLHNAHEFVGDALPLKYIIQPQFQMAVTDATFSYVGALVGTELRYRGSHATIG